MRKSNNNSETKSAESSKNSQTTLFNLAELGGKKVEVKFT
jgi:hypothetical protein